MSGMLRRVLRRFKSLTGVSAVLISTACGPYWEPPDPSEIDADGDGYTQDVDCNDTNENIYPEAEEIAYNGIDEDCSGADLTDVDGDGHDSILAVNGDDCNDNQPTVYPGAVEVCDGMANGCDAYVDDVDHDGYAGKACGGADCDDANDTIYPFAEEVPYDGIDQDCDSEDVRDADGDGEEALLVGGTDCDDSSETGNQVTSATEVFIPGGVFVMGSDYLGDKSDEYPPHDVYLSGYCIDLYEVSNEQYKSYGGVAPAAPSWAEEYYSDVAYNSYPVVNVDWQTAQSYCEGLGKTLPTEAQWEKAARGGECLGGDEAECVGANPNPARTYPWGEVDDANPLTCEYANFTQSGEAGACTAGVRTTAVTGQSLGRSPYGVYNLSGNVSEWVYDWYSSEYYDDSVVLEDPQGPSETGKRAFRGGSYLEVGGDIRTSKRFSSDSSSQSLGFRCARNIAWPDTTSDE